MSESGRVELQLGHLCNNRCVFCISGHLTHRKEAPILPTVMVKDRLRAVRAEGVDHLTFLGGEPTIQPFFMEVLQYAVELGFSTIVIFSNGSRIHRPEVMEAILATGGNFEFRLTYQGGNERAHERTTRRKGSWRQLIRSLEAARLRGQRVTVNMCVVRQNFESVADFPALLEPHGVSHLHLDMVHPDDTPGLDAEGLRAIMPRYSDLVAPLRAMARGFSPGFEFGIGNLPPCVAPDLAAHIHHGGQDTRTTTAGVAGVPGLNEPWDKYAHKQKNKIKPDDCGRCVFAPQCSGVFRQYAQLHGVDELVPVTARRLVDENLLALGLADALDRLLAAAPFGELRWRELRIPAPDRLEVRLEAPEGGEVLAFLAPRRRPALGYTLQGVDTTSPPASLREGLRQFFAAVRGPGGSSPDLSSAGDPR